MPSVTTPMGNPGLRPDTAPVPATPTTAVLASHEWPVQAVQSVEGRLPKVVSPRDQAQAVGFRIRQCRQTALPRLALVAEVALLSEGPTAIRPRPTTRQKARAKGHPCARDAMRIETMSHTRENSALAQQFASFEKQTNGRL